MTDEALRIGAMCLRTTLDRTRSHSRSVDGDLVLVRTGVLAEGGVLVGPDGSVLYLDATLSPEEGVKAYRAGARTPRELFQVFDEALQTRR